MNIVLISTPWPLFKRPSIQLGALKAYLKAQNPDLEVTARHMYLAVAEAVGYEIYQAVSERTWIAETIYGALLYPERSDQIEALFRRKTGADKKLSGVDFTSLIRRVERVSSAFIDGEDWDAVGLAGFSVCLCQLTSALYFIRQIKKRHPNLPVVAGGSSFSPISAGKFVRRFPDIDFIVTGEGEIPLSNLIDALGESNDVAKVPDIPGVYSQRFTMKSPNRRHAQLEGLHDLPSPDFDEYFELLKTFGPEKTFFPTLPVEMSRGCWWNRLGRGADKGGCAFCNLNKQWRGYRVKEADQAVREADALTSRYKLLSVAFTDNLLPVKASNDLFKRLSGIKKNFKFFGEIRADAPESVLRDMRRAGFSEVQAGIESLSTRLLKKLNKGVTAAQNLHMMKTCEELGVKNTANLIFHFPGSDETDVLETLRAIEFAMVFRPLRPVNFWLGLGSPVCENPKAYGLTSVFNHPYYALIFPQDIRRSVRFVIQAYRGDLMHQRKLWRPVMQKVRTWQAFYQAVQGGDASAPALGCRDGREFMIIRQKRMNAEPFIHRLEGLSRKIYLFCERPRSVRRILAEFPDLSEDRLLPFLKMMTDKKLMFDDADRFLSLAVREHAAL